MEEAVALLIYTCLVHVHIHIHHSDLVHVAGLMELWAHSRKGTWGAISRRQLSCDSGERFYDLSSFPLFQFSVKFRCMVGRGFSFSRSMLSVLNSRHMEVWMCDGACEKANH